MYDIVGLDGFIIWFKDSRVLDARKRVVLKESERNFWKKVKYELERYVQQISSLANLLSSPIFVFCRISIFLFQNLITGICFVL